MPIRKPLVTALVALSLGSAGNTVIAGDPRWIDVISSSWVIDPPAVGGNQSITVGGARTESVGPMLADRDVQLKGRNVLQNAPGAQEAYLRYQLKPVMITNYSMSGTSPSAAGDLKLEPVEPKAAIAINTPLRTLPNRSAADPSGSFSSGSTAAGELSPPVTSLPDSSHTTPWIGRRETLTTHSYDHDRPSSSRPASATKYEDIKIGVGAGMGRAPAAADWAKAQEIRASDDVTAHPGSVYLPAVQKVREAAARMSSELTPADRAAYVGGSRPTTPGGAGYGPTPPVQAGAVPALAAPHRSPTTTDGTTSTLMIGERTQRIAPGAPAVRR